MKIKQTALVVVIAGAFVISFLKPTSIQASSSSSGVGIGTVFLVFIGAPVIGSAIGRAVASDCGLLRGCLGVGFGATLGLLSGVGIAALAAPDSSKTALAIAGISSLLASFGFTYAIIELTCPEPNKLKAEISFNYARESRPFGSYDDRVTARINYRL